MALVRTPDLPGTLTSANNTDRWVFTVRYRHADGATAEDFTPERCVALVRNAIGVRDLPVELLSILPWEPTRAWRALFVVAHSH